MLGVRTRVVAVSVAAAVALAGGGGWAIARRIHRSTPSVEEAVARVGDADPRLLPTKIPLGWKPVTRTSRSFFSVTYAAPGGRPWVRVAIAVPNPALPAKGTVERTMRFRNDRSARYQVTGDSRHLQWSEPGTWTSHVGEQPTKALPYELAGDGVSEEQFFAIARSLRSAG